MTCSCMMSVRMAIFGAIFSFATFRLFRLMTGLVMHASRGEVRKGHIIDPRTKRITIKFDDNLPSNGVIQLYNHSYTAKIQL